jgi:hypothetical protein
MRRREFIMLLSCAAAIWPLAARAQQPERMLRVGILLAATADDAEFQAWVGAFLQALALLGWTIGRNVSIRSDRANPALLLLRHNGRRGRTCPLSPGRGR